MADNIEGKIVIVTGASSGMGEAAARHLAARGASVVVAARRAARIEKLVDTALEKFGRVDVLVNNAGVMPLSPVERLKVDEWDLMIDVNLRGVLYGIAAVLPHMKAQKSGHIITTASVAGHKVFPASAVYSATKFAVRALCEGLRQEVKPYNIRTTVISPGAVTTELLDHISEGDVQTANRDYVGKVGVAAATYARMVAFAISEPADVDINEIVFRPTAQEL